MVKRRCTSPCQLWNDAARELLRNYEKCNQYPENVTLHERQLGPLRVAVEALDRAKQEAEHAKP